MADLLMLPRPAKIRCRLQHKNLNILCLLKRKEWPQCHRDRAFVKYARAAFAKRKRSKAVCPKHQIMRGERVKVSESRTSMRKRGLDGEHEEEGWTSQ